MSLVLPFGQPQNAQAAVVSNFSVNQSRLEANTSTDMLIRYVTSEGIVLGDSFTLTFPADYDLSSLSSPGDFDLQFDNGDRNCDSFADETLGATAGAANWGVAVSGQDVTFTTPTFGGGFALVDSCVQVLIGQNASSGGAGANRIINPTTTGNYKVHLTSNTGDFGSADVAIIGNDTVNVNACVGGCGGSEGTVCSDPTSPIIIDPQVINITETSATVIWESDSNADSQVKWGTSLPTDQGPLYNGSLGTSYSFDLTGLLPGTTYFVDLRNKEYSPNCNNVTEQTITFTTIDTTPPQIINPQVINITQTSGTVIWSTDELADSEVDYGLTLSYEIGTVVDGAFVINHSLDLTGLTPDTEYFVRARSTDPYGNSAEGLTSFRTLPDVPPGNVQLFAEGGECQNNLSWILPADPDLAGVLIVFKIGSDPTGPFDGTELFNDISPTNLTHTGLTHGTEYHYAAFAYDTEGQFASGALAIAIPTCTQPPEPLSIFNEQATNVTTDSAEISWETNRDADQTIRWGVQTPPELGPIYDPTQQTFRSFSLTGLQPDTLYTVVVRSEVGGQFDEKTLTFRTLPVGPPTDFFIYNEQITNITSNSARVTWLTNLEGDGLVDWGVTSNLGLGPQFNPAFSLSHGFNLTGLQSNTLYQVFIRSEDGTTFDTSTLTFRTAAVGGPSCGDRVCEVPETPESCPIDCPTGGGDITMVDIRFFAAQKTIELPIDESNEVDGVVSTALSVVVEPRENSLPISSVVAGINNDRFTFLRQQDGTFEGTFLTPNPTGKYDLSLLVRYSNGNVDDLLYTIESVKRGQVYVTQNGRRTPVSGAEVTLFAETNSFDIFNAQDFSQVNPLNSSPDGSFYWYVPANTYYIEAAHPNYNSSQTSEAADVNRIINRDIELGIEAPVVVEPPPVEPPVKPPSIDPLSKVRELPAVKETVDVAIPVVAVTAAVSLGVLAFFFDLLPLLQLFFTSPILLFWKRRRKTYGVVYNSETKLPVDLAIVRLFRLPDNKLIRTRVTDKEGRYAFLADKGIYRMSVTKPGYEFPTKYLANKKSDAEYLDLYHGEEITVSEDDAVISANIPIDKMSEEKQEVDARIRWKRRLRVFQNFLAVFSVFLSLFILIIRPSLFTFGLFLLQVVVYFFVVRLSKPKKPKSWGIVYDKKTSKPIKGAVVRVFEPKYNKLLETRVTDRNGRYFILLGPNEYYATFEKDGYQLAELRPIDYRDKKRPEEFSATIELEENKTNGENNKV